MLSRGIVASALVLPPAVVLSLLLPPAPVTAQRIVDPASQRHEIGGWTGSDPDPLVVVGDRSGSVSAVFTTTADGSTTVWESQGDVRGAWRPARVLADDVVAGSASFAGSRTGRSVLAWSAEPGDGTRRLLVSSRTDADGAWSPARELATDTEGFDQMPAIDVSDDGTAILGYRHDAGAGPLPVSRTRVDGRWADPFVRDVTPGTTQVEASISRDGYAGFAYDALTPNPDHQRPGMLNMRVDRWDPTTDQWLIHPLGKPVLPGIGIIDLEMGEHGTHIEAAVYPHRLGGYDYDIDHTYEWAYDCAVVWDCQRRYHGGFRYPDLTPEVIAQNRVHKSASGLGVSVDLGPTSVSVSESNLTYWNNGFTTWDQERPNVGLSSAIEGHQLAAAWLHDVGTGVLEQRLRTLQVYEGPLPNRGISILGPAANPGEVTVTPSEHTVLVWADPDGTLRSHELEPAPFIRVVEEYQAGDRAAVRWAARNAPAAARYDVRLRQGTPQQDLGDYSLWKRRTSARRAVYDSRPGRTLCFSSRTRRSGTVTAWSRQRCTAVPTDDSTAQRSEGWDEVASADAFGGSRSVTRTPGSRLVLPDVAGHSLAVLVETGDWDRGRFRVTWAGRPIGVFSTDVEGGTRQVLMPIAQFREPLRGDVVIEALDEWRVVVDGIHVNRAPDAAVALP